MSAGRGKAAVSEKPDKSTTRVLRDELGERLPQAASSDRALSSSGRLSLHIEGTKAGSMTLQFAERMVVGRSDADSDTKPDLDLAPYGGELNGVSRAHAVFAYRNNAIFVEDLGSTNGTRLNGLELVANQPYRLRDGDELEFGRVRVTLRFVG
jgi:predicted component of type VI protein secretion system